MKNTYHEVSMETERQDESSFWAISYIDLLMILLTLFVLLLAYSKFPSPENPSNPVIVQPKETEISNAAPKGHKFSIGPVYTNRKTESQVIQDVETVKTKATVRSPYASEEVARIVQFNPETPKHHAVVSASKTPAQAVSSGYDAPLFASEFGSWIIDSIVEDRLTAVGYSSETPLKHDEITPIEEVTVNSTVTDTTTTLTTWFKIGEEILFNSGSASLSSLGEGFVDGMLPLIENGTDQVIIEGHTDDVPISNGVFPSNWSLATARAAVVGERLISAGIEPGRIKIIGFGATKPQSEIESLRKLNRRVSVYLVRR